MEVALKSFENLTEEEKIKFLAVLTAASSPTKCEKSKEYLKDLCLQSDESKKGQKTLDNWLLNKNILLKNHKQTDAKASNCNPTTNEFSGSSLPAEKNCSTNNVDSNNCAPDISVNKVCIKSSKASGNNENLKRRLEEDTSPNRDNKLPTSAEETSVYNLRSKRKKVKIANFEEEDGKKCISENISNEIVVDSTGNKNAPISCNIESSHSLDSSKNQMQGDADAIFNSSCDNPLRTNQPLGTKKRKSPKFQSSQETNIYSVPLDANNHSKQLKKSNKKDVSADTTCLISEFDYEAFHKLKEACSLIQLDIHELLQHEGIQNLLSDKEYCDDSIIFFGAHETTTGKVLPVVHAHKSKMLLSEKLNRIIT